MRYLLDTHAAIWIFQCRDQLSQNATTALDDLSSDLYISIVSAWEIAIKISIGKLNFPKGVSGFLETIKQNDIKLIGVLPKHVQCVETLPFLHRDPFDRLLVATAIIEKMSIVTADENIQRYDVKWIW
jgi:PIN domain nuclease of toxin-antitoxin system